MKKIVSQKWFPHVVAVGLFLLLTSVFFSPVVLENKDLQQGDITSWQGMGKDAIDYQKETGESPFWSNAMFSGMPGNYTGGMPPSMNVFKYAARIFRFDLPSLHLGIVFVYLLGFYIFLLSLGCKPWLSMVGAIAYAFASYNLIIIEAGHVTKGLTMATMAPVLGGIILTYRGKYLLGALITLVFTGINIVSDHQQITYYLMLIIAILAAVYFVYAVRERRVKNFLVASAILVCVGALAAVPALGRLIPTMDYTKESMRGGAVLQSTSSDQKASSGLEVGYAFAWSYGIGETMTLLIPNFYGGSSHYNLGRDSETYRLLSPSGQAQFAKYAPTYWGDNNGKTFTSGPVYAGAIVCFLFVLGLFVVEGREKWWLLLATVLSIMLAWGRHFAVFNDFLFYHLPLYSKFRTPEMALVIANVTMAIMAVLALKAIMEQGGQKGFVEKFRQPFYISAGLTGGLCLLFWWFGGAMFDFSSAGDARYPKQLVDAFRADRANMLSSDALRSLIFIALGAGAVWLFAKNKIKANLLVILVGVLILVDLWSVDKRFLGNDKFVQKREAKAVKPTQVDLEILKDTDPNYRVLNLSTSTFNESATSYFHKSVGGYSPAKLRRYQDMIDYHLSSRINMDVLNMLNTRYVIVRGSDGNPQLQRNWQALGSCWFVDSLRWMSSPDEEILALNDFNPSTTAMVDVVWQDKIPADLQQQLPSDTSAKITMTSFVPGHIFYESSSAEPRLAVFSEVFYKTWKAYIDGQETPLIRANYILRALPIPAGEHKIEMRCKDELYLQCAKLSLWGSILVGLVIAAMVGALVYRREKGCSSSIKISPK